MVACPELEIHASAEHFQMLLDVGNRDWQKLVTPAKVIFACVNKRLSKTICR